MKSGLWWWLVAMSALGAGCSFGVGALPAFIADGGARPDAGGGFIAGPCDPKGAQNRCDGMLLDRCVSDGSGYQQLACGIACGGSGAASHCKTIVPDGPVEPSDFAGATAAMHITADTVFNTDTGQIESQGQEVRPAGAGVANGIFFRHDTQGDSGVDVGVFGARGITLGEGIAVSFTGASAAVLVSEGDVTLAGAIDLSGGCQPNQLGPAGRAGGSPGGSGKGSGAGGGGKHSTMPPGASGGGGAGHGDDGGDGGPGGLGAMAPTGGSGGSRFGDLTGTSFVLTGGSGGGGGGGVSGGVGGAGGGAFEVAVDGKLTVSGTVNAGGCGGAVGTLGGGGGGGGAGGTLVFEAYDVLFADSAVVVANGGGGGAGDGLGSTNGANASLTLQPAPGGTAGVPGAGAGGHGGAHGQIMGGDGAQAPAGGGGGGAVGRIAIKFTPNHQNIENTLFSPNSDDTNDADEVLLVLEPSLTVQ